MRLLPLALAALLLPLAGCAADPPGEGGDGGPTPSATATATASSPAAPPAPAFAEVAVPFEREGETWTTVCAGAPPAGVGQCHHAAEGSPLTEMLPEGEPLLRLRGELSWDGGNAEAGIGVVVERDGEWTMAAPELYAAGPSPLAFDFDLSPFQGERLGFHVAS